MTFSFDQKIPFSVKNSLSGKLRPSGRFSLIQIFRRKTKRVMSHEKEVQAPQALHTVQQLDDTYSKLVGGDFSSLRKVSPGSSDDSKDIGLSDGAISPNRAQRGSKGINPRQRDLLCWGATTLERIYSRPNLSFLTYTLPDLSPEHLEAVRANWGDIVNRVQLRIKEKLSAQGVKTAIVGCTELQLERYQDSGNLYPHLHMVFRGRRDNHSDWSIKPHQYRQIWRRCLSKFIPTEPYTWTASENVQGVRKSVSGYLAKYVSKCASKTDGNLLSVWHPKDWIIVGRRIRQLYESMSLTGEHISDMLSQVVGSWRAGYGYVGGVYISTPAYGERRIGFVGWLRGEDRYPDYSLLHPISGATYSLAR